MSKGEKYIKYVVIAWILGVLVGLVAMLPAAINKKEHYIIDDTLQTENSRVLALKKVPNDDYIFYRNRYIKIGEISWVAFWQDGDVHLQLTSKERDRTGIRHVEIRLHK